MMIMIMMMILMFMMMMDRTKAFHSYEMYVTNNDEYKEAFTGCVKTFFPTILKDEQSIK